MTHPWPPGRRPAAAAAPSLLRTMNQRLLLDHLFATGSATRPQLARDRFYFRQLRHRGPSLLARQLARRFAPSLRYSSN